MLFLVQWKNCLHWRSKWLGKNESILYAEMEINHLCWHSRIVHQMPYPVEWGCIHQSSGLLPDLCFTPPFTATKWLYSTQQWMWPKTLQSMQERIILSRVTVCFFFIFAAGHTAELGVKKNVWPMERTHQWRKSRIPPVLCFFPLGFLMPSLGKEYTQFLDSPWFLCLLACW